MRGECREDGPGLLVPSARKRGSGHKLEHGRLLLCTRSASVQSGGWSTGCPEALEIPKAPGHGVGHSALGVTVAAGLRLLDTEGTVLSLCKEHKSIVRL